MFLVIRYVINNSHLSCYKPVVSLYLCNFGTNMLINKNGRIPCLDIINYTIKVFGVKPHRKVFCTFTLQLQKLQCTIMQGSATWGLRATCGPWMVFDCLLCYFEDKLSNVWNSLSFRFSRKWQIYMCSITNYL